MDRASIEDDMKSEPLHDNILNWIKKYCILQDVLEGKRSNLEVAQRKSISEKYEYYKVAIVVPFSA